MEVYRNFRFNPIEYRIQGVEEKDLFGGIFRSLNSCSVISQCFNPISVNGETIVQYFL